MPDDWHERLRAVMITTYGAGRDRLVRSNQCASLYVEDTGGGVSPLMAVCHEAALAPEEGGAPACGEDRRVRESYSTFSRMQSSGTVQKSPGISSSVSI